MHQIEKLMLFFDHVVDSYPGRGGGGADDIFERECATLWSLYRPFLEFFTKKVGPFSEFLCLMEVFFVLNGGRF